MSARRATAPPAAPERVESARLELRRPVPDDLGELAAMLGDPRVGAWLGGVLSPEGAEALLRRHIAHWEAHGYGLWIVRDRQTGVFAGRGGLSSTIVAGRGAVEVGWAIVPDRRREGLATELGAAALEIGARRLGLREVVSFTLPDNLASRRVMEKLGLSAAGEIEHRGLPHVLYRGTLAGAGR